jgi:hypothetical protein
VLDLMDEDAGQVFSHDVLSCVFCDQPVDDEQFRFVSFASEHAPYL